MSIFSTLCQTEQCILSPGADSCSPIQKMRGSDDRVPGNREIMVVSMINRPLKDTCSQAFKHHSFPCSRTQSAEAVIWEVWDKIRRHFCQCSRTEEGSSLCLKMWQVSKGNRHQRWTTDWYGLRTRGKEASRRSKTSPFCSIQENRVLCSGQRTYWC